MAENAAFFAPDDKLLSNLLTPPYDPDGERCPGFAILNCGEVRSLPQNFFRHRILSPNLNGWRNCFHLFGGPARRAK
jgi:hypothetical protein